MKDVHGKIPFLRFEPKGPWKSLFCENDVRILSPCAFSERWQSALLWPFWWAAVWVTGKIFFSPNTLSRAPVSRADVQNTSKGDSGWREFTGIPWQLPTSSGLLSKTGGRAAPSTENQIICRCVKEFYPHWSHTSGELPWLQQSPQFWTIFRG